MTDEMFVTPEQLAALLCLTTGTLAKWRITGRGPRYVKMGSRVRYASADIDAWLAEHAPQRSTVEPCTAP